MIERATCISVPPLSLPMPQPPFPHCNSTCTVGRPNQYMEYQCGKLAVAKSP